MGNGFCNGFCVSFTSPVTAYDERDGEVLSTQDKGTDPMSQQQPIVVPVFLIPASQSQSVSPSPFITAAQRAAIATLHDEKIKKRQLKQRKPSSLSIGVPLSPPSSASPPRRVMSPPPEPPSIPRPPPTSRGYHHNRMGSSGLPI